MRAGNDDVVPGIAGHELGMQRLVAVEQVVADLDARFLLEVLDRIRRDVIGPVVDIENPGLLCRRASYNFV